MAIEAELADGTILEFPDGTPDDVVNKAVQNYLRGAAPAKTMEELTPSLSTNPTDGMSAAERYKAGVGKSLVDGTIGLTQSFADFNLPMQVAARLPGDPLGVAAGKERLADVVEAVDRRDAPLMQTTSGALGNVSGYLAQLVGPAIGLRATQLGRMLLPTTVKGNLGLGAATGAVQPAVDAQDRAENVAIGGGAGAGAAALTNALRIGVQRALPAFTRGRQEAAAANAIESMAANPAAVRQALATQPNAGVIVPGSRPTLAEMTGDPGLSGLQRTMQSLSPEFNNQVTLRAMDNNASRVGYLAQMFGGADESAVQAAELARDRAASPLLRLAKGQSGVETSGVVKLADRIIQSRDKRPAVQSAVREVRDLLVDGDKPVDDIQRLLNVRQSIGDMLGSRAGANSDAARAATRELLTIRAALDSQMRKASPEYGDWLRTFREGSREADRIRVGQALTEAGSPISNSRGERVLSPAQFSRAADDLDAVARRATGFRKARADTLLTPEQRMAVDQVRRDLERFANVGREGKAIGSNSVQNAVGVGKIQELTGPVAAGALTGDATSALAISGLNSLRRKYGEATMQIVQEALADPTRAAEILSRLPSGQRSEVVQQVAPLLARSMAASGGG